MRSRAFKTQANCPCKRIRGQIIESMSRSMNTIHTDELFPPIIEHTRTCIALRTLSKTADLSSHLSARSSSRTHPNNRSCRPCIPPPRLLSFIFVGLGIIQRPIYRTEDSSRRLGIGAAKAFLFGCGQSIPEKTENFGTRFLPFRSTRRVSAADAEK